MWLIAGGRTGRGEVRRELARAMRAGSCTEERREGRARRDPRTGPAVRRRWFIAGEKAGWLGVARSAPEELRSSCARREAGPAGWRSAQAGRVEAGLRRLVASESEEKEREGMGSTEGKREREIE